MTNQTIFKNRKIIGSIRDICVKAAMQITRDTDGVINTSPTNAEDLDTHINLINATIDQELIRRYGV